MKTTRAGLQGPSKTIRVEPIRLAPEPRPAAAPRPVPAKEPAKR